MTGFDECPFCGKLGVNTFAVYKVYECDDCGTQFCDDDDEDGHCPECESENYREIGALVP